MNIFKYISKALVITLLLALVSCEKDTGSFGSGYLGLDISSDKELVVVGTKAGEEPVYKVTILSANGDQVAYYDNHNELVATPLKLKAGTYTVIGTTGEDGGYAAFDMPLYRGETTVEVVADQKATAKVVCTLSQVKVSVACDETITESFETVVVTVTNGEDFSTSSRNLIYSSESGTLTNDGYFECTGILKYTIYLVNNDGEVSDGEIYGTLSSVKPREWYTLKLTLSADDKGGAILPGITIDGTTNDHKYDIMVNLNKKAKPAFSTNGFNLDNIAYVSLGSALTWNVDLVAKAGIERLKVSHNSAELLDRGIPQMIELVTIDEAAKTAVNNAGFNWSGVEAESVESMTLDFSALLTTLPVGDYEFVIAALDQQAQEVIKSFRFKVIPAVETSTVSADAWGKHAFLYGMYNTEEQPAGMGFEYKKVIEPTWTKVTDGLTIDGFNYSVKIANLEPETVYVFRTVSDKEPSNEIEFTTLPANQIDNMSFDDWFKNGKHWYANVDLTDANFWWDSGNEGANTLNEVNPTKPEETDVAVAGDNKKAARLTSSTAAGQFAAGSLFLGDFGKATLSPMGAKLNFGRPYYCKPLSLKGWYNYAPVTIDKTKAPYTSMAGKSDICQVYVVLADWPDGYFEVSTGDSKFIDFDNDPNIIAYGSLENNASTNGWVEFEIPIEYRNNRRPTTCLIVCSSSKYGDYFTGGVGSCLIVDEFEFTF